MQTSTAAIVASGSSILVPEPQSYGEMAAQAEPQLDWLWHGYLAGGNITLLTSQWKTGKTTLLAVLLERLHSGRELAGHAVRAGRAAVITEESPVHWRMRGRRLDFGPQACFFCRPFKGKPTRDQWQALVDRLERLRAERGLDLVVIDTLSSVLPCGVENHADAVLQVLRPLEQLTAGGVAVLILHHPRKGTCHPGQAARGSGALTAYADVVLEMTCPSRWRREDRRRILSGWSRHAETPQELAIELTEDGGDYTVCERLDEELDRALQLVRSVLESEQQQMTRAQILARWPQRAKPAPSTLWSHLERGVELGQLAREGTGRSGDAFRYTLPGTDFSWLPDIEDILNSSLM
jgi:hypothetical protein